VGRVDEVEQTGIPWLTTPQRDLLAHLTVVTLLPQMQRLKPDRDYTYQRLSDALGDIADEGLIDLRADDENVWVVIHGQVVVHAARDWLEWMTQNWTAATRN
jgi:hypothetical protein